MMICLRGKLSERKEDGKWIWKGEWAFGETVENGFPFDYSFAYPQDILKKEPTTIVKTEPTAAVDPVKPTVPSGETIGIVEKPSETMNASASAPVLPQEPVSTLPTASILDGATVASVANVSVVNVPIEKSGSVEVPVDLVEKLRAAEPAPVTAQSTTAASVPVLPRTVEIQGHKLPASGKWTGHFMTVGTARKGSEPPQFPVNEHFYISWQDAPGNLKSEERGNAPPPPTELSVTGKGENQYGRFSLDGFLDLATFTLQCQRQYILHGEDDSSTRRSYQTRKRQLTWKRKAALDEPSLHLKKLPPPKKSKLSIQVPASMGPKKRQVEPKQQVGQIKLPSAGEPASARWRAAHFFHYQPPSAENSTPKYVVYEGELLHQKRHGRGVCLYNNGMLYEGEWKLDKEHGRGKLMTADRKHVSYEGIWERGRMHGEGIYRYSTKSQYAGEWRENLRHGDGSYRLEDGSVYDGTWREGSMCGRGVFTWPDGSLYDGEWKDNKRHGVGILKTADGFSYDGAWVFNSMEGRGSATYPGGQEYHGMWSRGRREGRGTIHFTNGAVYEGRFKNDAIDGQGTLKIARTLNVPKEGAAKPDFMIPVSFQSDLGHIHRKAGFSNAGQ